MKNVDRVTVTAVLKRTDKPDLVVALVERGVWEEANAGICYFRESEMMPVDKLNGLVADEMEMSAWTDERPGPFNLRAFLMHKMGQ